MNENETVRELCAEIREYCDGRRQPYDTVMQNCANRIERIYKRELAAKDAKIARHKAALKPVLECPRISFKNIVDDTSKDAINAVREAKRIAKEGE